MNDDDLAKSLLTDKQVFDAKNLGDGIIQISKVYTDYKSDKKLVKEIYEFSKNEYVYGKISKFKTCSGNKIILTISAEHNNHLNKCINNVKYIVREITGKDLKLETSQRY